MTGGRVADDESYNLSPQLHRGKAELVPFSPAFKLDVDATIARDLCCSCCSPTLKRVRRALGARVFFPTCVLLAALSGTCVVLSCSNLAPPYVALGGVLLPFAWYLAFGADLNVQIIRILVRRFEFWFFSSQMFFYYLALVTLFRKDIRGLGVASVFPGVCGIGLLDAVNPARGRARTTIAYSVFVLGLMCAVQLALFFGALDVQDLTFFVLTAAEASSSTAASAAVANNSVPFVSGALFPSSVPEGAIHGSLYFSAMNILDSTFVTAMVFFAKNLFVLIRHPNSFVIIRSPVRYAARARAPPVAVLDVHLHLHASVSKCGAVRSSSRSEPDRERVPPPNPSMRIRQSSFAPATVAGVAPSPAAALSSAAAAVPSSAAALSPAAAAVSAAAVSDSMVSAGDGVRSSTSGSTVASLLSLSPVLGAHARVTLSSSSSSSSSPEATSQQQSEGGGGRENGGDSRHYACSSCNSSSSPSMSSSSIQMLVAVSANDDRKLDDTVSFVRRREQLLHAAPQLFFDYASPQALSSSPPSPPAPPESKTFAQHGAAAAAAAAATAAAGAACPAAESLALTVSDLEQTPRSIASKQGAAPPPKHLKRSRWVGALEPAVIVSEGDTVLKRCCLKHLCCCCDFTRLPLHNSSSGGNDSSHSVMPSGARVHPVTSAIGYGVQPLPTEAQHVRDVAAAIAPPQVSPDGSGARVHGAASAAAGTAGAATAAAARAAATAAGVGATAAGVGAEAASGDARDSSNIACVSSPARASAPAPRLSARKRCALRIRSAALVFGCVFLLLGFLALVGVLPLSPLCIATACTAILTPCLVLLSGNVQIMRLLARQFTCLYEFANVTICCTSWVILLRGGEEEPQSDRIYRLCVMLSLFSAWSFPLLDAIPRFARRLTAVQVLVSLQAGLVGLLVALFAGWLGPLNPTDPSVGGVRDLRLVIPSPWPAASTVSTKPASGCGANLNISSSSSSSSSSGSGNTDGGEEWVVISCLHVCLQTSMVWLLFSLRNLFNVVRHPHRLIVFHFRCGYTDAGASDRDPSVAFATDSGVTLSTSRRAREDEIDANHQSVHSRSAAGEDFGGGETHVPGRGGDCDGTCRGGGGRSRTSA